MSFEARARKDNIFDINILILNMNYMILRVKVVLYLTDHVHFHL